MAGSRSLGTLTVDLVAKIAGFEQGMNKAERELDKRAKRMNAIAKKIGVGIGTAISAGVAASAALATGLKISIDRMDELSKAALRASLPTEQFTQLAYAGDLADVSMEELTKSLGKLAKAQGDAQAGLKTQKQAFEQLGIAYSNANGSLRSTHEVFLDFADAFQKYKGSPEVVAAGMQIFGRSFQTLIPLLKDGRAGLEAAANEADRLGITLSTQAGQQAEEFNDNLTRLKTAVLGLTQSVAANLLPDLVRLTDQFVGAASNGDKLKETAQDIADILRALGAVTGVVVDGFKVISGTVRGVMFDLIALGNVAQGTWDILSKDFAGAADNFRDAKLARELAAQASDDIEAVFKGTTIQGPTVEIVWAGEGPDPSGLFKSPAKGLNPITPTASGNKGKTEAERAAERLARALNQMTDAQRKWQTELAGTGNPIADEYARKLDQITEKAEDFKRNGIPTERVAEFTEEMKKLALAIKDKELAEFQKEFDFQTKEMVNSVNDISNATIRYERALSELDKTLKSGVITQDEYQSRLDAIAKERDSAAIGLLKGLRDESTLLGMSSDQQEIWNNLKWAGVEADSELGRQIIASTKALQEQREAMEDQIEIMDGARSGAREFFDSMKEGEGILKSLEDAFGRFADALYDWATNSLIDQFFGKQGTSGQGTAGGGWLSALFGNSGSSQGSIFDLFSGGWGFAGGGTMPAYSAARVNELGMEMASVGGKDYLLTGSRPVEITPHHRIGGGVNITMSNFFDRNNSRATPEQIAVRTGQRVQRELARTGR